MITISESLIAKVIDHCPVSSIVNSSDARSVGFEKYCTQSWHPMGIPTGSAIVDR